MSDMLFIPFPKELYHRILMRSGGVLDPALLAVDQVEGFIERNMWDSSFWTEEGLRLFKLESEASANANIGDTKRGYQWQQVFLPNGTDLRITYKNRNFYARVQHERIVEGKLMYASPSEWASKVADNTSRNAWRDVWIKRPVDRDWTFANSLRERR